MNYVANTLMVITLIFSGFLLGFKYSQENPSRPPFTAFDIDEDEFGDVCVHHGDFVPEGKRCFSAWDIVSTGDNCKLDGSDCKTWKFEENWMNRGDL